MRLVAIFAVVALLLAGCATPPVPAKSATGGTTPQRETRTILVLSAGPALSPEAFYAGKEILAKHSGGLLKVADQALTQSLAGTVRNRHDEEGFTAQIEALMRVGRRNGIDYIVFITDYQRKEQPFNRKESGRLNLIGTLGFTYETSVSGTERVAQLGIEAWDCVRLRRAFRETFGNANTGAFRPAGEMDDWLGLAVARRLVPWAIIGEETEKRGDYTLSTCIPGELRFATGDAFALLLVQVRRLGDHAWLILDLQNPYSEDMRLRLDPGSTFCTDQLGTRYALTFEQGFEGVDLAPGAHRPVHLQFKIPDRHVARVNLNLKLSCRVGSSLRQEADLTFANVPLTPPLDIEKPIVPHPRGKTAPIPPVRHDSTIPSIVFVCPNHHLTKGATWGENMSCGDLAHEVRKMYAHLAPAGVQFYWLDTNYENNPSAAEKAREKFSLTMPTLPCWDYPWLPNGKSWNFPRLLLHDGQRWRNTPAEENAWRSHRSGTPPPGEPPPTSVHAIKRAAALGLGRNRTNPIYKAFGHERLQENTPLQAFPAISRRWTLTGDISPVREQARNLATNIKYAGTTPPSRLCLAYDDEHGMGHLLIGASRIDQNAWNPFGFTPECRPYVLIRQEGRVAYIEVVSALSFTNVSVYEKTTRINPLSGKPETVPGDKVNIQHHTRNEYDLGKSAELSRAFLDKLESILTKQGHIGGRTGTDH